MKWCELMSKSSKVIFGVNPSRLGNSMLLVCCLFFGILVMGINLWNRLRLAEILKNFTLFDKQASSMAFSWTQEFSAQMWENLRIKKKFHKRTPNSNTSWNAFSYQICVFLSRHLRWDRSSITNGSIGFRCCIALQSYWLPFCWKLPRLALIRCLRMGIQLVILCNIVWRFCFKFLFLPRRQCHTLSCYVICTNAMSWWTRI